MAGISGIRSEISWVASSKRDPLCEATNKIPWVHIRKYALTFGLTVGLFASWSFASTFPFIVASIVSLMAGYIFFLYQKPLPFVVPEEWEDVLSGPISLSLLEEPMIAQCGHTYERIEVNESRRKGHNTCSICREPFNRLRKNRLIIGFLNHLHRGGDPVSFIEAHRYETSVGADGHSYALITEILIQRAKELYGQVTYEEFLEQNRAHIYEGDTGVIKKDVNLTAIETILTSEHKPAFNAEESTSVLEYAGNCSTNWHWIKVLDHLQKVEEIGE